MSPVIGLVLLEKVASAQVQQYVHDSRRCCYILAPSVVPCRLCWSSKVEHITAESRLLVAETTYYPPGSPDSSLSAEKLGLMELAIEARGCPNTHVQGEHILAMDGRVFEGITAAYPTPPACRTILVLDVAMVLWWAVSGSARSCAHRRGLRSVATWTLSGILNLSSAATLGSNRFTAESPTVDPGDHWRPKGVRVRRCIVFLGRFRSRPTPSVLSECFGRNMGWNVAGTTSVVYTHTLASSVLPCSQFERSVVFRSPQSFHC